MRKKTVIFTIIALSSVGIAHAYDFSAVSPSGHTIYYAIRNNTVGVARPANNWVGYTKPTGNLIIPDSVMFNNTMYAVCYIDSSAFAGCNGMTSITIPNTIATICYGAFYECTGLTSVTIPNSVTTLERDVFASCTGLTSISIPNTVTVIPQSAFYGCVGLTTISIPSTVLTIRAGAFYACNNLIFVYMCSVIPPYLEWSVFSSNPQIEIPCGANYQGRGWDTYSNLIHVSYPNIGIFVYSNDTNFGQVSIVQQENHTVYCDSTTIIQAIPNNGYHFDHWSNGNTANPDTLHLMGDSSVTAIFLPNQYAVVGTVGVGYQFNEDFEQITSNNIWVIQNSNCDNKWFINALGTENRALFISNDGGQSNAYSASNSMVYAHRTLTLPAGQYEYSYNWRCTGESGSAFIRVALLPDNVPIDISGWGASTLPTGAIAMDGGSQLCGHHAWQIKTGYLNITTPGVYKLVFYWYNNGYFGGTAAAIDNISIGSNADITIPGGIVSGSDTVNYLSTVVLSAIPNYGYYFVQWHDGITLNPRSIVAIHDSIFYAFFDYNQYNLFLSVDTSIHGSVVGSGSYNYLSNRQIQAHANFGYHFSQWNDGDTNNPRTILLTQDTSFVAQFSPNQYSLTLQSADAALGSVTGGGTFVYRDTAIIQATAMAGHYHFQRWSDNNTDNPRQYVVNGNATLSAYFTLDSNNITAQADNPAHGMVSGSGTYAYGSTATISATTPYSGYRFSHWSDGATYNPYTIAVLQDTTVTAIFIADGQPYQDTIIIYVIDTIYLYDTIYIHDTLYISPNDIAVSQIVETRIYQRNGQIVVEGSEGLPVRLYDSVGRLLATKQDSNAPLIFNTSSAGAYLIRIGNNPARRVVVMR